MTKHDLVLKAIIVPDLQSLRQVWDRDIVHVSLISFSLWLNVTEVYYTKHGVESARIENHFDYSAGNVNFPLCTRHRGSF